MIMMGKIMIMTTMTIIMVRVARMIVAGRRR